MAFGLGPSESGGVMAPADVRGAGEFEWATIGGLEPTNPLVGGPSYTDGPLQPDRGRNRIVTTPDGNSGPATSGVAASPDGMAQLDDWRDLFNLKGSPMPWLLILALAMLGFMQFRLAARASAGRARLGGKLALG